MIIELLVQHGVPPLNDNKSSKFNKKMPPPIKPKVNEKKL